MEYDDEPIDTADDADSEENQDDQEDEEDQSDEPEYFICNACNGSGEGSYDGSSCRVCKGMGSIRSGYDNDYY